MDVKHTRVTTDGFTFDVIVSTKNSHAHGAMTRADKQVVTGIIAKAADELEQYLRQVEDPRQ